MLFFLFQFLEQVCNLLFTFYRSAEEAKKRFAIAFVPSLIELHLRFLKIGREPLYQCIDVVLLGLYNLEGKCVWISAFARKKKEDS